MDNERDNSIDSENDAPVADELDTAPEDDLGVREEYVTEDEPVAEERITEICDSPGDTETLALPSITEKNESKPSKLNAALSVIYEYIEVFAVSIIAVILIFTFSVRLCQVDGDSMNNTLKNKELIVVSNLFYEPKQDDIIVFHLVNDTYKKPLVKRVIATEGQTIVIYMKTGVIEVDGVVYEDEYAYLTDGKYSEMEDFDTGRYDKTNRIYAATVPEGHVFVLGDNRNHSNDSRMRSVGFVDVDTILGKAIIRIAPFTLLE